MTEQRDARAPGATIFDLADTTRGCKRRIWLDTLNGFFYDYEARLPDDFSVGRIAGVHVGGLSISRVRADPMHVWRTRTQIERDALDAYFVLLPGDREIQLAQRSREAVLDHRSFALVSTSTPYAYRQDARAAFDNLIVPGAALRCNIPNADDLLAVGRGTQPVDRLFMDYARSVCGSVVDLDEGLKERVGRHLVELLSAALDGADRASAITPVRLAHLRRIRALVEQGFSDPGFNLDRVASRLRLSRRYVQELLAAFDLRFALILRRRRLEEAQVLLRDRRTVRLSVSDIAYKVGFTDAAYFSKAYKAEYGCSPRDTRLDADAHAATGWGRVVPEA